MTTPNPDAPHPGRGGHPPVFYQVSLERLNELNRSAITLLAARRHPYVPVVAARRITNWTDPQELLDEISGVLRPTKRTSFSTNMPIQEIVFRTLLTRRNEPISLAELHHELDGEMVHPGPPHSTFLSRTWGESWTATITTDLRGLTARPGAAIAGETGESTSKSGETEKTGMGALPSFLV